MCVRYFRARTPSFIWLALARVVIQSVKSEVNFSTEYRAGRNSRTFSGSGKVNLTFEASSKK